MPWAYQNGNWVKQDQAVVPLQDAGFLFGEAVFETLIVKDGQIFQFDEHFERMKKSLFIMKIDGINKQSILKILLEGIKKNKKDKNIIRITITSGLVEEMDLVGNPAIYINFRKSPEYTGEPLKVMFLSEKVFPVSRTTRSIKSSNYFWNRLALRFCQEKDCFGPVFYNEDGHITEGSTFNVFFVRNGEIHTSSLAEGILPGVTRQHTIKVAKVRGIPVFERKICLEEVKNMDEAFITATTMKIQPIFWDGFKNKLATVRLLQRDYLKL